jgi:hypothetical protein
MLTVLQKDPVIHNHLALNVKCAAANAAIRGLAMFALRLVQLIETQADKLSERLLDRLRHSGKCNDLLSSVPPSELQHRAHEIYHNLTDWMSNKTESEIKDVYIGIGAQRAHQNVPFSQFLYATHTTKQNLWDYLRQEGLLEPGELIGEMDMLHEMEHFFDRAVYFAAIGYEEAIRGEPIHSGMVGTSAEH